MKVEPRIVFDTADWNGIEIIRAAGEDTGAGRYFPHGIHAVSQFKVGNVVDPERIEQAINHISVALENMVSSKLQQNGGTDLAAASKLIAVRQLDQATAILNGWLEQYAGLNTPIKDASNESPT